MTISGLYCTKVRLTHSICTLTVLAFGVRWLPINRDAPLSKTDRHIAGAAPFAGTGGRVDFAGLTAKRLRDHINLGLQGQVFVSVSDFQRLFLQLRQGFGRGPTCGSASEVTSCAGAVSGSGSCPGSCSGVGSGVGCSCSLAYSSLTASCVSSPGVELIHQLPAPFPASRHREHPRSWPCRYPAGYRLAAYTGFPGCRCGG